MPAHSFALGSFGTLYYELPVEIQRLADKQLRLFRENQRHPSLGFARKGTCGPLKLVAARRALARMRGGNFYWFWIGSHEAYNNLLPRFR
jgi:hypothetical protein